MPRPLRVNIQGALYHVTSSAPSGKQLFLDAKDYEAYIDLLRHYRNQYGFKLFAYTLLPGRLHLAIELVGPTTLSTIMHAINSRYTKHYTKRYSTKGHVFKSRFKSTIMEKNRFILPLSGYLHSMPKRVGLANAQLVYPWCSLSSYLSPVEVPAQGMSLMEEVEEVLHAINSQSPGWTYEQYVRSTSESVWKQLEETLHQYVAGSDEFISFVQTRLKRRAMAKRVGPIQPVPQPGPQPFSKLLNQSWKSSLVVAASVCMVVVAFSTAGFYAENVASLKQAVHALEQEQNFPKTIVVEVERQAAAAGRLVHFIRPSNIDGTAWDIRLIAQDKSNPAEINQDLLRFEGRKIYSSRFGVQGFAASTYKLAVEKNQGFSWEAEQKNVRNEVISWSGKCDGRVIKGTVTRTHADGEQETFNFLGMLRNDFQVAMKSRIPRT